MTGAALGEPRPVRWTTDFFVLDAQLSWAEAAERLSESTERWVVISRHGGLFLYAILKDELWQWPSFARARANGDDLRALRVEQVLELHETQQSTKVSDRSPPPAIDRSWRAEWNEPSIERYVEVASDGNTPRAIGVAGLEQVERTRGTRAKPPERAAGGGEESAGPPGGAAGGGGAREAEPFAPPPSVPAPSPADRKSVV